MQPTEVRQPPMERDLSDRPEGHAGSAEAQPAPLHALVVSQYFWPENFEINRVAEGLVRRGHRVTVLTGLPNYPDGSLFKGYRWYSPLRERYAGAEIIRVPLFPRGGGSGVRLALNYLSFALSASVLGILRKISRPDVVLAYEPSPVTVGIPAIVMRWMKRAPLLFWVQDLWPESLAATGAIRARWALKRIEELVRFIYARSDLILIQSRAFRRPIESLGVEGERIAYLPNSAPDFYRPLDVPADAPERAMFPDGFNIVYAGNIGAAQDFATILGAAERTPPRAKINWLIFGDGRMRAWVEREIEKRGLAQSVRLLGRLDARRMPYVFGLADALLVTLRRDPIFAQTVPSKVQSYLASGRPILAALDGEGADIVREAGAGMTARSEDPEGLADAAVALSQLDAQSRNAMGKAGRQYFEKNFEAELLLERLEQWMAQLSARKGRERDTASGSRTVSGDR
jgi:colanic acid biosynthesis glycosyl transferase WcaI